MTWYYVKDGAASGPISDDDFASQLRSGSILPTTLVWRSGMVEWQTASSVADEVARRAATPVAPAPAHAVYPMTAALAEPGSTTPPVLPGFFCTYCGNIIPADQLVRISGRNVCAACKPRYVQQVSEGLAAPVKVPVLGARTVMMPDNDLADPSLRLVGHILDLLFVMVPMVIGYFVVAAITFGVFSAGRPRPAGDAIGRRHDDRHDELRRAGIGLVLLLLDLFHRQTRRDARDENHESENGSRGQKPDSLIRVSWAAHCCS